MTVLETPRISVSHLPGMVTPWIGPFPPLAPTKPVVRPRVDRTLTYLRGDRALPQLIRFALVGGSSNIAYVLLFFAMHGVGPLIANVAGSVVSTVIANELHRQLTFHAADRVTWFTAQWEGGGLALLGLGITTAGLAALGVWAPGLGDTVQALAVLAITAAVGGMRFLALRGLVF
ncbi:GtrA family protein [Nocardia asteroides]|uniref:GtrA family protein n=1 Tax=Nocardia asteroides TaxID=1824 RepID=UPI001E4AA93D|nr:GtrA family protein [Nocardia asteroides]UGT56903.1 GtrA family protein [Nocardia asteroides]